MRKLIVGSVLALALAGGAVAYAAGPDGPGFPHMRFMHEEPAFMLDAKLAGMKAALKLTPDQEKTWAPFEAAVRDADSARREGWKAARERMQERPAAQSRRTPELHVGRTWQGVRRTQEGRRRRQAAL